MTEKQDNLYWRLWGQVCRSNHWRMARGRLDDLAEVCQARSQHHSHVLRMAGDLAVQAHCAVTVDLLRRACHVLAAGRNISHKNLKPEHCDRLFCLFRLLIDPDDLNAQIGYDHPELGERRRLVWRIERAAPFAYINALCEDLFNEHYSSPYWEDLPVPCLRALARKLAERTRQWRAAVPMHSAATVGAENTPF